MTDDKARENAGALSPDASAKRVLDESIALHEQLKSSRSGWDAHWQNLATYCQPRKAFITEERQSATPDGSKESQLFDSTAIQANMTLASGHMSWMTPAESLWFAFTAPREYVKEDEVKGWFHQCSLIASLELSKTNFYNEIHECYLDRGCFGTTALYIGESRTGGLTFRAEENGSYSILENSDGAVDTLIREFKLTFRQAYQEYGDTCHPKLIEELKKEPVKGGNKEATFIQCVYPRLERDKESPHYMNKAFASVHVDITHKHVCRQGGFDELPFAVSRYLKWGSAAYGWAPSWMALPDMRQLNFLAKNLDLLTELKLNPRLLIPAGMRGIVDMRPGGITYMKEGLAADQQPKEWATVGDIKEGMLREEMKRKSIKEAFHVDLFQMFAQMERTAQMTAREVAERASEKLIQFSPTFARMTTELYIPFLRRFFRLMFNRGKFPPPPHQIMQQIGGQWLLPEPQIEFSSRVALAMRQLENVSFMRTMDGLSPIAKIQPDILMHYDWNTIARDMARNEGLPESWMLPAEVVEQMKQQRDQRNAQLEQSQVAESMAGAAAKLGSIPPNSPIAQMVANNAGKLPGTGITNLAAA